MSECADACVHTNGCTYFVFGKGSKYGQCYYEYTKSAKCKEGWETDKYDFAKIQ